MEVVVGVGSEVGGGEVVFLVGLECLSSSLVVHIKDLAILRMHLFLLSSVAFQHFLMSLHFLLFLPHSSLQIFH